MADTETTTKRDELIDALADVLDGLQVPVSMGMPLGKADAAWRKARELTNTFGWTGEGETAERLRAVLDG